MKSRQMKIIICVFIIMSVYLLGSIEIYSSPEGEAHSGNNIVMIDGWDLNTTRDTNQYILTNLSAHIFPEHFCDHPTLLTVMVCSSPSNFDARNAIRESWGRDRNILGHNVSLFFLLGETSNSSLQYDILNESVIYGDVIVERFIDSYNNLTLKSIVMLKLVSGYCGNSTKYLFKIDDDMFVNMEHIVRMLLNRTETDLLMGKLICDAKPIKDSTSKWYAPRYMYSGRVYPNYLSGTGYIMSISVAGKLYKATLSTPIFHLEDVYITGCCAQKANIKRTNNNLFTYQNLNHDLCIYKKLLTIHRFPPNEIRRTFQDLRLFNNSNSCHKLNNSINSWLQKKIADVHKPYRRHKCE